MTADWKNKLYYGDNLDILPRYVPDESIDLIYLDPPFNSNASYNVLFPEHGNGSRSVAQLQAFKDTWTWAEAAPSYYATVEAGGKLSEVLQAFRQLVGDGGMLAYLSMMGLRLAQLHRVLKPTGSIYLHCDPTASHYLKLLMDAIFGPQRFRSEIVWKRSTAHSDTKQGRQQHGRVHDVLLYFTNGDSWTWNALYTPYDSEYVRVHYPFVEGNTGRRYGHDNLTGPGGAAKGNPSYEVMGVTRYWRFSKEKMDELVAQGRVVQPSPGAVPRYKRYLDEMLGVPPQDVWTDITAINSQAQERLGYPTQKPEALLDRIIRTSSNEGDLVLDPFCGCGTATAVAQRLGRRWIGIDITYAAIAVIKKRLLDIPGVEGTFKVIGEPVSVPDAQRLAAEDPYQFQWWALGLLGARPAEQKKGADHGIDGTLYFHDELTGPTKQIIFSVKAGHTGVSHVSELAHVVARENAQVGVLITMQQPTGPMKAEAAAVGFYTSPWGKHPRLQLLTVADILAGKGIDYPKGAKVLTFKDAPKSKSKAETKALPL